MGAAREKTEKVESDEVLDTISRMETMLYVVVVGLTLFRVGYEAGKAKVK